MWAPAALSHDPELPCDSQLHPRSEMSALFSWKEVSFTPQCNLKKGKAFQAWGIALVKEER